MSKPTDHVFFPHEPSTWAESGLEMSSIEPIALQILLNENTVSGRDIGGTLCLPLALVRELLDSLRAQRMAQHKGTAPAGDFIYELTDYGRSRAFDARQRSTYVGAAPVSMEDWERSIQEQWMGLDPPREADLRKAFGDLLVSDTLLERLGPAVVGAHALFLFGAPGNGKTVIAERIARCFGDYIWIPQAIYIGGQLIKLYDPSVHQLTQRARGQDQERADRRWVMIQRPDIVAGAELTMEMLDVQMDPRSNVADAPLQVKANGGVLVLDDFGRQRTDAQALLNRWIQPLERHRDYLKLPDGRKFAVPFGAMLVFCTNLDLRRSGEEAFLRRILHKITMPDPTPEQFASLTLSLAKRFGVSTTPEAVDYLIKRHFTETPRAMRFSQPKDLLIQVVHRCIWEGRSPIAGPAEWDRAIQSFYGER